MTDELYKLSGGGNDFLARVVDGPDLENLEDPGDLDRHLPRPDQVRDWTRRGLSLGADGFFVLGRVAPGRARMIYLNSDGTRARLCLNGTRCAARLAFELGWQAPHAPHGQDRLVIDNDAGAFPAWRVGPTEVSVLLPPLEAPPEPRAPEAGGRTWPGWYLPVGVPHFVIHWQGDLADAPVTQIGRLLRHHEAFAPEGTNVDFACFPEPGRVEVRSYERGVEAETLACGTGVVATLAVGLQEGLARLPSRVTTRGGFVLHAHGDDSDQEDTWSLAGDARIVARVTPTSEASGLPARPWE